MFHVFKRSSEFNLVEVNGLNASIDLTVHVYNRLLRSKMMFTSRLVKHQSAGSVHTYNTLNNFFHCMLSHPIKNIIHVTPFSL